MACCSLVVCRVADRGADVSIPADRSRGLSSGRSYLCDVCGEYWPPRQWDCSSHDRPSESETERCVSRDALSQVRLLLQIRPIHLQPNFPRAPAAAYHTDE